MQGNNTETKSWLKNLFSDYRSSLNGSKDHAIHSYRKSGFEALEGMEFPTRRDEDWKYFNVTKVMSTNYQIATPVNSDINVSQFDIHELDAYKAVFVNGYFVDNLSSLPKNLDKVEVHALSAAMENQEYADWIHQMIENKGGTEQNTFLHLNRAFSNEGMFIKISKNGSLDKPLHIMHVNTQDGEAHFSHPQMFLHAEQSSSATIIESYHSLNVADEYFTNSSNYVQVDANADVHHYRLQMESGAANHINNTIVTQNRDSVYSSYAIDLGGAMVRNNISTELLDSNTNTHYYGVYLGNDNQQIDNQTFIDHAVPHCESNEIYKGILKDRARGVFNGKVLVRRDAQKTNAFQQNSSLVLSKNAIMDAKPQLEIYADDVKCSHGATIGQLDESSVFYLKSRGISENEARKLLQKAFLFEVLENFQLDSVRDLAYQKIENKCDNG